MFGVEQVQDCEGEAEDAEDALGEGQGLGLWGGLGLGFCWGEGLAGGFF
jgi:hypothetical protein